jgi:UPF0176 protein
MYQIAALYHFAPFPNYVAMRQPLLDTLKNNAIVGSLLIASEGINGTIAGEEVDLQKALQEVCALTGFNLEYKLSYFDKKPFVRAKVRLKKEIVKLGVEGIDPLKHVGQYVAPQDWNALIQDPEVLVLDTRNDYEFRIGTFENAVDPQTKTFNQLPKYVQEKLDPAKHKKIAMFCTGGIRCEKASSYLISQGFENVYHLKGGVLKYLETVPQEQSLWKGDCYVFDDRIAVGHGLEPKKYDQCFTCGEPMAVNTPCPTCFPLAKAA